MRARTGVHTGEVIVGDAVGGGKLATGDAMNVAARLEQRAGADEILISAATHRLVHDAVQVEEAERLQLKGRDERVQVYRLLKVDPSALGFARRLTAPMVGRDRELSLLRAAFDRAVSDRACQLFTVLGVGGVGKSRLLGAFVDELGEGATVLRGRCLPYGDGITFWPIIEAIRPAAALSGSEDPATSLAKIAALIPDDDQADRIARQVAQIMGLEGGEAVREETFWAIRRLLEGMARTRPVALVIDDMQWAEPTMLELVEHIAEWAIDAPILVACMARPELLEVSPGWGGGKLNATSISLEPLSARRSRFARDQPARGRSDRPHGPRPDRAGGRGPPAVRRGDARDARGAGADRPSRRDLGRGRRPRRARRATDDIRARSAPGSINWTVRSASRSSERP